MNVDTGEFRALTEQVERLTEQVAGLDTRFGQVLRSAAVLQAFGALDRAYPDGRERSDRVTRPPGPRPDHLRLVGGGQS